MYMKVLSPDDAFKLSDLIKDGDWMVLYYAEWCGHCNAMKPEWEKFITKMKDTKVNSCNVKIADVKSDFIDDLKNKPEIPGFPTIKMYSNGKEVADFKEERIAENMVKFAQSNTAKSSSNNKARNNNIKARNNNIKARNNAKANQVVVVSEEEPKASNQPERLTKDELPMETINLEELPPTPSRKSINAIKSLLLNNNKKSKKATVKASMRTIKSHKSRATHKVSNIKNNVKPLVMDDLLQMPVDNKPVEPQPVQPVQLAPPAQSNYMDLPCNQIRKAKFCKANPKCMFDYPGNKCVDKVIPEQVNANNKANNKASKRNNKANNKAKNTNNNKAKSTKEVFNKLIKSFSRISNEAGKDAKLLKNASAKL